MKSVMALDTALGELQDALQETLADNVRN